MRIPIKTLVIIVFVFAWSALKTAGNSTEENTQSTEKFTVRSVVRPISLETIESEEKTENNVGTKITSVDPIQVVPTEIIKVVSTSRPSSNKIHPTTENISKEVDGEKNSQINQQNEVSTKSNKEKRNTQTENNKVPSTTEKFSSWTSHARNANNREQGEEKFKPSSIKVNKPPTTLKTNYISITPKNPGKPLGFERTSFRQAEGKLCDRFNEPVSNLLPITGNEEAESNHVPKIEGISNGLSTNETNNQNVSITTIPITKQNINGTSTVMANTTLKPLNYTKDPNSTSISTNTKNKGWKKVLGIVGRVVGVLTFIGSMFYIFYSIT